MPFARAPIPEDEERRLAAVHACEILDTPPEPVFDDLTALAARVCSAPVALLTLVDRHRQWFKSRVGLEEAELPREVSFCAHAIVGPDDLMVVPDAWLDPRFARNPLVTGPPRIRLYAGSRLRAATGEALGTLCVIDRVPRELPPSELSALAAIARQVESQLDLRRQVREMRRALVEREAMERAARQSEVLSRAILDAANYSIISTNPDGVIQTFNATAERWLGYRSDELVGLATPELVHDPDEVARRAAELSAELGRPVPAGFEAFVARARGGVPDEREWSYVRKDGTRFPVSLSITPLLGPRGELTGFLGIARDVTERRRGREELRRQAEQYRLLFEEHPLPVAVYDAATLRFLEVNEAAVEHYGYSREEFLSLTIPDLVPPEDRAAVSERALGLTPKEVTTRLSLHVKRDGTAIDVEVTSHGSTFNGRPARILLVHDVTQRRRAMETLRASEARVRAMVGNMLTGLVVIGEGFRIEEVNPAAERIFGYTREELLGERFEALLPPPAAGSEPPGFDTPQQRHRRGRFTELEGRRKDGQRFPLEMAIYEFESPDGRRLAAHIQDISERREVERLKKEFVATVSHELRTPLTSIRGSLSLLSNEVLGKLPIEAREVVDVAERNTLRLISLINDILDLERLESGRQKLHFGLVPMAAVLSRAGESVLPMAARQQIRLEIPETTLAVPGDEERLVQVLVNLLSNAVKFSLPLTTVTVRVEAHPGEVEVSVSDQGRGIPQGLEEAIFERFRQVEASDSRQRGGTGLGLAISKAIVEQHGGAIGVTSRPGGGSTFWFRIPTVPA